MVRFKETNSKIFSWISLLLILLFIDSSGCSSGSSSGGGDDDEEEEIEEPGPVEEPGEYPPLDEQKLEDVKFFAYQIQGLEEEGAIEALESSHYDLVVLEPTRSAQDMTDFDTAGMVRRLHESTGSGDGAKIVIAYVDVGEAEDWRWYWEDWWVAPTQNRAGVPDFMVRPDPDGWAGNYPVAFWDERWKEIMIYGENSSLKQVLDDGFDGIYMDWIEAYQDEGVLERAEEDGVDPKVEMVNFIGEIRDYARSINPDFIVIQQNAPQFIIDNPSIVDVIDAIGQEDLSFYGEADTEWGDSDNGDKETPEFGDDYSREWLTERLKMYRNEGKLVLTIDYALKQKNIDEAYEYSLSQGFIPFVSQTPLSRLPDNTPPGYPE